MQVNTAKGPWPLLDLLEAPLPSAAAHPAFLKRRGGRGPVIPLAGRTLAAAFLPAVTTQAPAMSLDAVLRVVRDVAADIAGDDMFEGAKAGSHSATST